MVENIEKTVLATLIYNYDLFEDSNLKTEYFYNLRYGKIFEVLKKLQKKELPFDENLILKELDSSYESVILDLLATNSISNVRTYEKMIIEEFEKREFKKFLNQKINDLSNDETSYLNVLNQVNSFNLNNSSASPFKIVSSSKIKAEKPEILIPNICPLQKKEINLFTAKGGKGKSFTVLYLLLEVQKTGLTTFGWFSEDSLGITKNRLEILQNTHKALKNIDVDLLGKETRLQNFIKADKNGNFEVSDFFFEFQKAMKPYDIIVIDPLISLIFKDENSNVEARFLMNLLNAWIEKENKTLILIHHEGKGEGSSSRGASAFIDAVRIHATIFTIENKTTFRKIKIEKSNHYSGKTEFEIELFKNEIKPIEVVFEDAKKENNLSTKDSNFDIGGIEILYDESPKEETLKLKKEITNKGVLFDD